MNVFYVYKVRQPTEMASATTNALQSFVFVPLSPRIDFIYALLHAQHFIRHSQYHETHSHAPGRRTLYPGTPTCVVMVSDNICTVVEHNGPTQFSLCAESSDRARPLGDDNYIVVVVVVVGRSRQIAQNIPVSSACTPSTLLSSQSVHLAPAPDYLQFMLGARALRVYRESAHAERVLEVIY